MIQTIGLAAVFIALAAAAFVASVRLGMLVGRRLDRTLEARAQSTPASASEESEENRGE